MSDKLRAAAEAALETLENLHGAKLRSGLTVKTEHTAMQLRTALETALETALAEPEGGLYLTVVYRDVQPGPECTELCRHPKVSAVSWSHAIDDRNAARAALDAPTGKQDLQEAKPAAWQYVWPNGDCFTTTTEAATRASSSAKEGLSFEHRGEVRALYAAPPRREWKGLTDEEIEAAWKSCDPKRLMPSFAAAVEAALKEKNA